MNLPRLLICIALMALVTYLPRMLPLVLFQKKITNRFVRSFLSYVPYAVLAAMTFPDIFSSTAGLWSAAAGCAAALILAWLDKGLLVVALGATATVLAAEWLLPLLHLM